MFMPGRGVTHPISARTQTVDAGIHGVVSV